MGRTYLQHDSNIITTVSLWTSNHGNFNYLVLPAPRGKGALTAAIQVGVNTAGVDQCLSLVAMTFRVVATEWEGG